MNEKYANLIRELNSYHASYFSCSKQKNGQSLARIKKSFLALDVCDKLQVKSYLRREFLSPQAATNFYSMLLYGWSGLISSPFFCYLVFNVTNPVVLGVSAVSGMLAGGSYYHFFKGRDFQSYIEPYINIFNVLSDCAPELQIKSSRFEPDFKLA